MVSILLDPDSLSPDGRLSLDLLSLARRPDFVFAGGSHLSGGNMARLVEQIKMQLDIPVVLFPGPRQDIVSSADGILLLSLVSGRNPDLLIGRHVESAFALQSSGLEVMPTAYILVDGGKPTSASYISFSQPVPHDKPMIAAATALAASQLGMKMVYLDAGSGADIPVSVAMIGAVRQHVDLPLIVGGGLKSREAVNAAWNAGADMVVLGTIIEKNPESWNDLF